MIKLKKWWKDVGKFFKEFIQVCKWFLDAPPFPDQSVKKNTDEDSIEKKILIIDGKQVSIEKLWKICMVQHEQLNLNNERFNALEDEVEMIRNHLAL